MKLRHCLRWAWAAVLLSTGALRWVSHRMQRRRAVVVLAMHRVLDDGEFQRTDSLTGMLLRRRTFERLAAYVARRLEIVDLQKAIPGQEFRRPGCAFTFDDGWSDNYAGVWPICHAYGIPFTVFLCPGLMGRTKPFWPERVAAAMKAARQGTGERQIEHLIESLKTSVPEAREAAVAGLDVAMNTAPEADDPDRTLSWTEVRELDRLGVTFGAHTQTHLVLTTVPEATARREIRECKDILEQALTKPCTLFAYPNGNHSPETREFLREAGFSLAFTTERGQWTALSDPLAIPRVNLSESDITDPAGRFSPALFQYTVFWKTWRASCAPGRSH